MRLESSVFVDNKHTHTHTFPVHVINKIRKYRAALLKLCLVAGHAANVNITGVTLIFTIIIYAINFSISLAVPSNETHSTMWTVKCEHMNNFESNAFVISVRRE